MTVREAFERLREYVFKQATQKEREAFRVWLGRLLEIRDSPHPAAAKAKAAILATKESKIVWPVVKNVGKSLKRFSWDDRKSASRWGIVGAGASIALFGVSGVGLAAFGGAIGIPLWIVFGAGGVLAHALYEELADSKTEE
jgi:hypothetical protein